MQSVEYIGFYLDKSVLEIFIEENQCIAVRVYPELSDSKGVSFFAHGHDVEITSLKKWEMENIFDESSTLAKYKPK